MVDTKQRHCHWHVVSILLITLAGLADAVYLAIAHYRNFTDIAYASFCAVSKTINCNTVAQSAWSILAGIPIAYWGIGGYLLFLILLLPTLRNRPKTLALYAPLFLLSLSFVGVSLYLGYISATKIHSYCIMCLVSYLINFLLCYLTGRVFFCYGTSSFIASIKGSFIFLRQNTLVQIGLACLLVYTVVVVAYLPNYWKFVFPPLDPTVATGMTEEGSPWIGAENPILTVEEYSDYQCFQCGKMHLLLRRFIAANPKTVRLVHHHYPLDHEYNKIVVPDPFHVGSGKMSLLAIYASTREKFWEMNDELFGLMQNKKTDKINLKDLAKKTGLDLTELQNSIAFAPFINKLQYDIYQGMKLRITGTPTYMIDGKIYQGSIPSEIFKNFNH